MKLVLASGSPRRREILSSMGFDFAVIPSNCDESVDSDVTPSEAVAELALRKARAVATDTTDSVVIGSDTVIDLDGRIIGKPASAAEAIEMLRKMSGRTHSVRTAVAVVDSKTGHADVGAEETAIQFRNLSDEEIRDYVATGEPLDKAGAYAIQGRGRSLIASVIGSEDTVVGLPRDLVKKLLSRFELS